MLRDSNGICIMDMSLLDGISICIGAIEPLSWLSSLIVVLLLSFMVLSLKTNIVGRPERGSPHPAADWHRYIAKTNVSSVRFE